MRLTRTITDTNREELMAALKAAPAGAQFDLVDDPRTTQQNKLMWALLTDISDQVRHCGDQYEPEAWKACFMKSIGLKLRFMPSLDGQSVVAVGYQSSRLDKAKFSELIESIYAFGAQNGIDFETRQRNAARGVERPGGASPGSAAQGLARQGEETTT